MAVSTTYLIPNKSELALLTGASEPEVGVQRLRERGVGHVIVTLGERAELDALLARDEAR